MSEEVKPVRPTRSCIAELGLDLPSIDVSLANLDHPLIGEAQRLPALHAAGGVERIQVITDLIWFKVKTGRWRGAGIKIPSGLPVDNDALVEFAPWWLGLGGFRRQGDPHDFYASLESTFEREQSSSQWLPANWDWKRLELELIYAWEQDIRNTVCLLIANSLRSGDPYYAEIENYRVTVLARAREGETYLAIGTENIADAKIFAVIINAVPGISQSDWQAEPGDVVGLKPTEGAIVWSTILPPATAGELLDRYSAE